MLKFITLMLCVIATAQAENNPFDSLSKSGNMINRREPLQDLAAVDANTDTSTLTVVDVIAADPSLSILANALKAADLNATLQGAGPFTILAPNDAAFAKISPNALEDLMKPENKDKLVTLLTYHVLPEKIGSPAIRTMQAKSANGSTLNIKSDANGVTINNAHILQKDIKASNGVIHIIDTVLVP